MTEILKIEGLNVTPKSDSSRFLVKNVASSNQDRPDSSPPLTCAIAYANPRSTQDKILV